MTRHVKFVVAGLTLIAGATPALAQTRVSFPMTGMPSYRTATPVPLTPRPTGGIVQAPVVAPRAPVVISQPSGFVTRGVVSSGSGLRISGEFTDDTFRVAFNLGSDFGAPRVIHTPGTIIYPYYGSPWYYGDPCHRGYNRRDNRYYIIDGALIQPQPAANQPPTPQPQPEPPPPPTTIELAAMALRANLPDDAVALYQQHLTEHPDDADAMRAFAVALLRSGEFTQAVAMFGLAYRTQPSLCERPMRSDSFWASDVDLRRDLVRLVTFANRNESGAAFLGVSILMQTQGRKDHALRLAQRAKAQGLDAHIADRLVQALSRQ